MVWGCHSLENLQTLLQQFIFKGFKDTGQSRTSIAQESSDFWLWRNETKDFAPFSCQKKV